MTAETELCPSCANADGGVCWFCDDSPIAAEGAFELWPDGPPDFSRRGSTFIPANDDFVEER